MSIEELIAEFTAEAAACRALADTLALESAARIEALARWNTWQQAANRLQEMSQ